MLTSAGVMVWKQVSSREDSLSCISIMLGFYKEKGRDTRVVLFQFRFVIHAGFMKLK